MGQHVWPEDVSGAVLATQMVEELVGRGHEVTFATCFPSYPKGIVFKGYGDKWFSRKVEKGATFLRSWSYISPRKTILRRLLNYASFSISVFFCALAADRPDIVVSFSPPFTLGPAAWLLSRRWGIPWVLRVEDKFPDAAVSAGIVKNKRIIQILKKIEVFQYRNASHVSVISESFKKMILKQIPIDKKISVLTVWGDPDEVVPMARETAFRKEHGLNEKFVILYAGSTGYTSLLEDVLEAANHLLTERDILFLIIGEGTKKNKLISMAADRGLVNVLFLPFQLRERYSEILASADISLVTLNPESAETSFPSKTFNYMASARPILGIMPLKCSLSRHIEDGDMGIVVPPGQSKTLADSIMKLKHDPVRRLKMGKNARDLLEKKFSKTVCVNAYEDLFTRLVSK